MNQQSGFLTQCGSSSVLILMGLGVSFRIPSTLAARRTQPPRLCCSHYSATDLKRGSSPSPFMPLAGLSFPTGQKTKTAKKSTKYGILTFRLTSWEDSVSSGAHRPTEYSGENSLSTKSLFQRWAHLGRVSII